MAGCRIVHKLQSMLVDEKLNTIFLNIENLEYVWFELFDAIKMGGTHYDWQLSLTYNRSDGCGSISGTWILLHSKWHHQQKMKAPVSKIQYILYMRKKWKRMKERNFLSFINQYMDDRNPIQHLVWQQKNINFYYWEPPKHENPIYRYWLSC